MSLLALVLTELTAELALFAAVGFLLFAIDDLAVDMIYFVRRGCAFPRATTAVRSLAPA